MSYGAAFNSTAGNLIDNMNYANEAIKEKYRGIVLVFDEFGRYVEDYGEVLKVKTVQDLVRPQGKKRIDFRSLIVGKPTDKKKKQTHSKK